MRSFFNKIHRSQTKRSDIKGYTLYDDSRHISPKKHLCHAPFNNMYFNIHGQSGPCWLTLHNGDRYPDKSIHDIWFGERFKAIRKKIEKQDLDTYCTTCKSNIESGNYVSVLAKLYDLPYKLQEYPSEIEFELSNRCNLECVMCKGELSSSIRKKREGLPEIDLPYDDEFVHQLREFIPHIKEAKFLGGEPFLIDIYCDIWDLVEAMNPTAKITVTTNGTALNNRIKNLIEKLDFHIIMSIDSFKKETYEEIRIGAVYETVMKNLEYFLDYAKRKDKYLQASINPLRRNWHELNEYVDYCNERNMMLWFNTVIYPHEEALWTLNSDELQKIQSFLASKTLVKRPGETKTFIYDNNVKVFENLIHVQLSKWLEDARNREAERADRSEQLLKNNGDSMLRSDIETYFTRDAYLVHGVKTRMISFYHDRLDKVRNASPVSYGSVVANLYKKPISDILRFLKSKEIKDIIEELTTNN
ncbi:MAG: radical SAM protein [Bacteroidetes bacterium]|nr:radical SAM protein [Bacteroidota bacterium]